MANIMDKFGVPLPSGRNVAMSQPKIKHKFRVVVYNFGTDINEADYIAMNVDEIERPSVEFNMQQVQYFDSSTKYVGKHNWKPVTLTIRDSVDNLAAKAIARQLQKQLDFHRRISAKANQQYSSYKFKLMMETTSGANPVDSVTNLLRDTAVSAATALTNNAGLVNDIDQFIGGSGYNAIGTIDRWVCYGCFISDISYDTISYGSSEYITMKLTIEYDTATQYDMIQEMYGSEITSMLPSGVNSALNIVNKIFGSTAI